MATPLPPEIETEILLRLPAKSLQRFTTVSKSWHSTITSSSFISAFNHRASHHPLLLLLKHPPFPHHSIHFSLSSPSFLHLSSFNIPTHPNDDDLKPTRVELVTSDSINGILCIIVHTGLSNGCAINCDLLLWNPSTTESFKIPNSSISGLFSGPPMVKFYAGFGYSSDDYKVIRVVYLDSVHATAELYSLKRNNWKKLGLGSCSGISSNMLWADSTCTFVNGVGYWGAYRRERKDKFFVLGFDFEKECFSKVKIPVECVDGGTLRYHSLWVYKEMLAISVLRFGEFESKITRHYMWVMMTGGDNEGLRSSCCWSKMFDVDLEDGPRKPIATLESGELLLLGEDDGEHALYDPESERVQRVDIFDVDAVVSYVESLVSFTQLLPDVQVDV